ncbi:MAG: response regulator, partial [Candidatus Nealsonbacteria bacterium CG_4_10_14_0_2_um_filter_37_10]
VARDGEEGLKTMKEIKPDLILLDIIMPKMGGLEVMEEMAKDEGIKDIPVIVISNSGQPVELDRAQKLGAKDWLIKTEFDPQEVVDKVVKQIGK